MIVALVILIDQASKFYVKLNFNYTEAYSVFDWFKILFVENNGMAFSIEILPGALGKYILTIFRIVIVSFLGVYIFKNKIKDFSLLKLVPLALIFAGAIGNIIDCLFYGNIFTASAYNQTAELVFGGGYGSFLQGKVVDMFYFPMIKGNFPDWLPFWGGDDFIFFRPIFNVADSAISVGIFFIVIFYKKVYAREFKATKSE